LQIADLAANQRATFYALSAPHESAGRSVTGANVPLCPPHRALHTYSSDDQQSRHIADQLFRSASGAAYNYRRACRGQSHRDFAKLATAHEEADESVFWLLFTRRGGYASGEELECLPEESKELLAILTASVKTAQERQQRQT
jgi:four helix bundle protein